MGKLENVIAWVSPERAYRREAYRQALEAERAYDAASGQRLNSGWRAINQSAESEDRYERDTIRARARDLENNSDIINGVLSAYVRNIVGKGITLQAESGDTELDGQIEALWKEWCNARNCDVTGTQTFADMLRMCVRRKKVDGGILLRKCYTSDGVVPFQLQALEVDELDTGAMIPHSKGNRVAGGVEYNAYNRPMGFFLKQYTVDGTELPTSVYVPAKDMIFWFRKRRPSQIREISDLAPVVTRVRDVNEFITAVSVKERIAACLSVFIKRALPTGGLTGRNSATLQAPRDSYDGKRLAPGMITEMNAGDEADIVNPQGTSDDASGFVKLLQRLIGTALGLSYESTTRDMSETNYSSARQGIVEDGMTYAEEQEGLTAAMNEIYETFFISAVLAGAVSIRDFWENKRKYMSHSWVSTPKPWIDPLKEANANKVGLMTGELTYKQLAAQNGSDWKKQIDDIAEVTEYARQKGVQIGGMEIGQGAQKGKVAGAGKTKS